MNVFFPEVCRNIHTEMVGIYWMLLPLFSAFVIVLDFFKIPESNPQAGDVLRRIVTSIILLVSFDYCMETMAFVGDALAEKIGGFKKLSELLERMIANHSSQKVFWLEIKSVVLYIMGLISYAVAYLGVFVAKVLVGFVWSVLYICSPLMILMYVWKNTAFVTASLYKGLVSVAIWKVLWSILGLLLLEMTLSPEVADANFLLTITMNLCIGFSMLFIPWSTKSLLHDGMVSSATGMGFAPLLAATSAAKLALVRSGKQAVVSGINTFGGRPLQAAPRTNKRKPGNAVKKLARSIKTTKKRTRKHEAYQ